MNIEKCIETLADRAAEAEESGDAMKLSQAAQNLSNVAATLQNLSDAKEYGKRQRP